jgi:phage protein D/phage baseplate assembly protein gpV
VTEYAAKPRVEVNGRPIAAEFDLKLERVVIDNHLFLPDMFVLHFRDPERDVIEKGGFEIGAQITVAAAPRGQEASEELIVGELTAIEAEFSEGGSHVILRGYDHSHRLHRGRRTETYRNVTDSDIARTIAQRVGLETGHIDDTGIVHRHISQPNISDWTFLSTRARAADREVAVIDGKLEFRTPTSADSGPAEGDLTSTDPLQLVIDRNLDSFHVRITSAEQVGSVQVRSWNAQRKQVMVATAPARTAAAALPYRPDDLAGRFGSPTFVVTDQPFEDQSEVDGAAVAIAERIAGTFADAEGTATGNPRLRPGSAVSVALAGHPFEGSYSVTSARHTFDAEGYKTHFAVTGRHVRSLLSLSADGNRKANGDAIGGVVVGQVTSVKDPDNEARVKLSFPWLSDNYESDWVRIVQVGAGNERGLVVVPEVNDEVLVAFEHGDIRRPYVVGGLYSGVDKPQLGETFIDQGTGEVRRRGFVSRLGHSIVFFDDDRQQGIALMTGDQNLRLSLNGTETTIKLTSAGKVIIEADQDITVSGNRVSLEAQAGISIDGGGGNVVIKGTQIKLN